MKNDINSFCSYPNYNQKLLIRFFTKSLRFLEKPQKCVVKPRPVNKASHQVPTLFRKKGWICDDFLYGKHFQGQKNQKGAKKIFEVNFTLLLHILPRWPTGLSLFAYLKGNLNSGFFHDFLLTICIFKDIKMKVRLKSMGFQSKSREKSIKNEQNQPLPVWGGPLECRYTVHKEVQK